MQKKILLGITMKTEYETMQNALEVLKEYTSELTTRVNDLTTWRSIIKTY